MKVAVVILNWNGRNFLEKFLPSVIGNNSFNAEIIVADNASTDDSILFLQAQYPQVKIILNTVNGGFAKGYNDALQHVKSEYYVLLNSDVEVSPGWIEPAITLMDSDKSIAACQPKIKDFHNKEFFEYAGAAGGFIDKFGYPFCRGRILETTERDNGQYDDVHEIFWATGACMFIRSECFHKAKGFDEDFFAHMEEIDLCWRLKNLGYKIMFTPDSTVYHVGGGTLNKTSSRKTFLNFRNNLNLLLKNHPPKFFFLKICFRMILDGVAAFKFLFAGQFSHFVAVVKAHKTFYGSLKQTLEKRKELKKQIVEYTITGVYPHSIVKDYYLKGKKTFKELDIK